MAGVTLSNNARVRIVPAEGAELEPAPPAQEPVTEPVTEPAPAAEPEPEPASAAEPEPESADELEDGSVEFFVQLLTKMEISPDKAREYAEGLVADGYDEDGFNEDDAETLQSDLGFDEEDAQRVKKYRASQLAATKSAGSTGQEAWDAQ